jgi:hypothetical protein
MHKDLVQGHGKLSRYSIKGYIALRRLVRLWAALVPVNMVQKLRTQISEQKCMIQWDVREAPFCLLSFYK